MPDFWHPFSMGNGMLCYHERHPLLLKLLTILLRCIRNMRAASGSIHEPFPAEIMSFLPRLTFKLHQKIVQGFGYPLSMSNWILYCKKRHSLLMRCFIIFMQCIRNIGGAHGRLCSPLFMVHTMPSWHKDIDSQTAHKIQDLAYPLSMGNGFALP